MIFGWRSLPAVRPTAGNPVPSTEGALAPDPLPFSLSQGSARSPTWEAVLADQEKQQAAAAGSFSDARAFLGRSLEEVQALLGPGAESVHGDEYGPMTDVTSIANPAVFPGTLYLAGGRVELVRLDGGVLEAVSRYELDAQFGGDAVRLRSRAGKLANLCVHAEQGVAYSAQGQSLDFLEVFRPRTQQAYEEEIYREPLAFIR